MSASYLKKKLIQKHVLSSMVLPLKRIGFYLVEESLVMSWTAFQALVKAAIKFP